MGSPASAVAAALSHPVPAAAMVARLALREIEEQGQELRALRVLEERHRQARVRLARMAEEVPKFRGLAMELIEMLSDGEGPCE